MEITDEQGEVAGLGIHWLRAGGAPILYLHGVPTGSFDWIPLLERTGGVAPDLPGFGRSAKPGDFDYSIAGYDRFLEEFTAHTGLERFSLVVHDWGGVGLVFAQRFPERIEKLVVFTTLPLMSGYRWHRVARGWRTPLVGELMMGFTTRWGLRRELPRDLADRAWEHFDHGTQRAILRLYRSADPRSFEQYGARLGELQCPALILWPEDDPYIGAEFGRRYKDALGGGDAELEQVTGGHWTWHERPELVGRVADFLADSR